MPASALVPNKSRQVGISASASSSETSSAATSVGRNLVRIEPKPGTSSVSPAVSTAKQPTNSSSATTASSNVQRQQDVRKKSSPSSSGGTSTKTSPKKVIITAPLSPPTTRGLKAKKTEEEAKKLKELKIGGKGKEEKNTSAKTEKRRQRKSVTFAKEPTTSPPPKPNSLVISVPPVVDESQEVITKGKKKKSKKGKKRKTNKEKANRKSRQQITDYSVITDLPAAPQTKDVPAETPSPPKNVDFSSSSKKSRKSKGKSRRRSGSQQKIKKEIEIQQQNDRIPSPPHSISMEELTSETPPTSSSPPVTSTLNFCDLMELGVVERRPTLTLVTPLSPKAASPVATIVMPPGNASNDNKNEPTREKDFEKGESESQYNRVECILPHDIDELDEDGFKDGNEGDHHYCQLPLPSTPPPASFEDEGKCSAQTAAEVKVAGEDLLTDGKPVLPSEHPAVDDASVHILISSGRESDLSPVSSYPPDQIFDEDELDEEEEEKDDDMSQDNDDAENNEDEPTLSELKDDRDAVNSGGDDMEVEDIHVVGTTAKLGREEADEVEAEGKALQSSIEVERDSEDEEGSDEPVSIELTFAEETDRMEESGRVCTLPQQVDEETTEEDKEEDEFETNDEEEQEEGEIVERANDLEESVEDVDKAQDVTPASSPSTNSADLSQGKWALSWFQNSMRSKESSSSSPPVAAPLASDINAASLTSDNVAASNDLEGKSPIHSPLIEETTTDAEKVESTEVNTTEPEVVAILSPQQKEQTRTASPCSASPPPNSAVEPPEENSSPSSIPKDISEFVLNELDTDTIAAKGDDDKANSCDDDDEKTPDDLESISSESLPASEADHFEFDEEEEAIITSKEQQNDDSNLVEQQNTPENDILLAKVSSASPSPAEIPSTSQSPSFQKDEEEKEESNMTEVCETVEMIINQLSVPFPEEKEAETSSSEQSESKKQPNRHVCLSPVAIGDSEEADGPKSESESVSPSSRDIMSSSSAVLITSHAASDDDDDDQAKNIEDNREEADEETCTKERTTVKLHQTMNLLDQQVRHLGGTKMQAKEAVTEAARIASNEAAEECRKIGPVGMNFTGFEDGMSPVFVNCYQRNLQRSPEAVEGPSEVVQQSDTNCEGDSPPIKKLKEKVSQQTVEKDGDEIKSLTMEDARETGTVIAEKPGVVTSVEDDKEDSSEIGSEIDLGKPATNMEVQKESVIQLDESVATVAVPLVSEDHDMEEGEQGEDNENKSAEPIPPSDVIASSAVDDIDVPDSIVSQVAAALQEERNARLFSSKSYLQPILVLVDQETYEQDDLPEEMTPQSGSDDDNREGNVGIEEEIDMSAQEQIESQHEANSQQQFTEDDDDEEDEDRLLIDESYNSPQVDASSQAKDSAEDDVQTEFQVKDFNKGNDWDVMEINDETKKSGDEPEQRLPIFTEEEMLSSVDKQTPQCNQNFIENVCKTIVDQSLALVLSGNVKESLQEESTASATLNEECVNRAEQMGLVPYNEGSQIGEQNKNLVPFDVENQNFEDQPSTASDKEDKETTETQMNNADTRAIAAIVSRSSSPVGDNNEPEQSQIGSANLVTSSLHDDTPTTPVNTINSDVEQSEPRLVAVTLSDVEEKGTGHAKAGVVIALRDQTKHVEMPTEISDLVLALEAENQSYNNSASITGTSAGNHHHSRRSSRPDDLESISSDSLASPASVENAVQKCINSLESENEEEQEQRQKNGDGERNDNSKEQDHDKTINVPTTTTLLMLHDSPPPVKSVGTLHLQTPTPPPPFTLLIDDRIPPLFASTTPAVEEDINNREQSAIEALTELNRRAHERGPLIIPGGVPSARLSPESAVGIVEPAKKPAREVGQGVYEPLVTHFNLQPSQHVLTVTQAQSAPVVTTEAQTTRPRMTLLQLDSGRRAAAPVDNLHVQLESQTKGDRLQPNNMIGSSANDSTEVPERNKQFSPATVGINPPSTKSVYPKTNFAGTAGEEGYKVPYVSDKPPMNGLLAQEVAQPITANRCDTPSQPQPVAHQQQSNVAPVTILPNGLVGVKRTREEDPAYQQYQTYPSRVRFILPEGQVPISVEMPSDHPMSQESQQQGHRMHVCAPVAYEPSLLNFVHANGEQTLETNYEIVYAAAAATAERDEGVVDGPPNKLRLLYAEALGVGRNSGNANELQFYYASAAPDQQIQQSTDNSASQIQLMAPYKVMYTVDGKAPTSEVLQYGIHPQQAPGQNQQQQLPHHQQQEEQAVLNLSASGASPVYYYSNHHHAQEQEQAAPTYINQPYSIHQMQSSVVHDHYPNASTGTAEMVMSSVRPSSSASLSAPIENGEVQDLSGKRRLELPVHLAREDRISYAHVQSDNPTQYADMLGKAREMQHAFPHGALVHHCKPNGASQQNHDYCPQHHLLNCPCQQIHQYHNSKMSKMLRHPLEEKHGRIQQTKEEAMRSAYGCDILARAMTQMGELSTEGNQTAMTAAAIAVVGEMARVERQQIMQEMAMESQKKFRDNQAAVCPTSLPQQHQPCQNNIAETSTNNNRRRKQQHGPSSHLQLWNAAGDGPATSLAPTSSGASVPSTRQPRSSLQQGKQQQQQLQAHHNNLHHPQNPPVPNSRVGLPEPPRPDNYDHQAKIRQGPRKHYLNRFESLDRNQN